MKYRATVLIIIASMLQACAWLGIGGHAHEEAIDVSLINTDQAVHALLAGRDLDPVEGAWEHDSDSFEMVIARNSFGIADDYDYVGVVTRSNQARWEPGDIKLLLRKTDAQGEFQGLWTTYNKSKRRMTFVIENHDLIQASFKGHDGNANFVRIRRVDRRVAHRL